MTSARGEYHSFCAAPFAPCSITCSATTKSPLLLRFEALDRRNCKGLTISCGRDLSANLSAPGTCLQHDGMGKDHMMSDSFGCIGCRNSARGCFHKPLGIQVQVVTCSSRLAATATKLLAWHGELEVHVSRAHVGDLRRPRQSYTRRSELNVGLALACDERAGRASAMYLKSGSENFRYIFSDLRFLRVQTNSIRREFCTNLAS